MMPGSMPVPAHTSVPFRFHWVWLGQNPLPDRDRGWMQSWAVRHPDARCTVWVTHPDAVSGLPAAFEVQRLDTSSLVNAWVYHHIGEYVAARSVWAARSDLVRMEVVALHGGIYLDTDVECFRNAEPYLRGVRLFVADEWGNNPGNYMFGAVPNHPALWTCVRELTGHVLRFPKNSNPVHVTGPHYLNRQLHKYASELVIFPYMLFNPLCAFHDPAAVRQYPGCSVGNHVYDGKWYDRKKATEFPDVRVPVGVPDSMRNLETRWGEV